ncbi:MAG: hypothetical protein UT84_C0015G0009 [Candidatus Curtissbacteria bacterium GW2011_GWA1_40_16]|uniref:Omega transcriptional repressor domain-containing protein n=1 Tax=Candidatus Curtissbacteria bacterium GW2011_GWA1_40_16 TaxID=1618405 RepID=A0A0G0RJK2_9BACT|nr:MAG: hypothetical protein UT84_C0015G0009 [Candidatus Curtissbacteria bacterium GW2011_GWA1_40_16]
MSKQINFKNKKKSSKTKLVRINAGIHQLVKIEAARRGESIRNLVESGLAEVLAITQRYTKQL